jgi:hypothetical protein
MQKLETQIIYCESIEFYNHIKHKLLSLYALFVAFVILNLYLLFFSNTILEYDDIYSLIILMTFMDAILLPIILFMSIYKKKALLFKRFQIGSEYFIMPYIIGIHIPKNRIPFSSISGVAYRNRGLPYFLIYVDINKIKEEIPKLGKVQSRYRLESSVGTLLMKSLKDDKLVILIDKNDFSNKSYSMLIETLTAQHHLKDLDTNEAPRSIVDTHIYHPPNSNTRGDYTGGLH